MCQHPHGMMPVFPSEVKRRLVAEHQLYKLGPNWPTLFERCRCSDADESLAAYEPITPDQAREWAGASEQEAD